MTRRDCLICMDASSSLPTWTAIFHSDNATYGHSWGPCACSPDRRATKLVTGNRKEKEEKRKLHTLFYFTTIIHFCLST